MLIFNRVYIIGCLFENVYHSARWRSEKFGPARKIPEYKEADPAAIPMASCTDADNVK